MPQPVFLPGLPTIPAKPNILRGGDPVTNGATVNGVVQPGPVAPWFNAEPLINLGTTACYQFSDTYCYSLGANPGLNQAIALDFANNQHTCAVGAGEIAYDKGGFVFVNNNTDPGDGSVHPQAISFTGTDLQPADKVNDYYVSTIWLALPAAPVAENALLFTYPDGSTWSLVAGVLTFTPVGAAAIPVPTGSNPSGYWTWSATTPLQLSYSRDAATDGSSAYSISVYVNGQKATTVNQAGAYTPVAPAVVGFGPNSVVAGAQFAFTAMRFYMEDTTVSGTNPAVVVATDYLLNALDLTQMMATNTLPSPV